MTTQLTSPPPAPPAAPPARAPRRWLLWLALVALVGAIGAFVAVNASDDGTTSVTPSTLPSTVPSTAPPTSPTVSVVIPPDTSTAVWPAATSTVRYTNPVDAARGFAVDFVGFVDPIIGQFQAGDSRSGEVEVRNSDPGPVTTVFVRQLGTDGTWWVLGSATDNIRMTSPKALDTIKSPVHLTGTSTAFEAVVNVVVYADGQTAPLAHTTVMGGSMGDFAPYEDTLELTTPHADSGAIVMYTVSMKDGHVAEASVIRVHFAS